MVHVIRVRFPETSVWNLPVVAHEFGHFVAPELETREQVRGAIHPVREALDREGKGSLIQRAHMEELFADLFATYVLGPAYACTCILLRWNAGTAYKDREKHPSIAKRVDWILKVLERMNENESGGEPTFWRIAKELRKSWDESLRVAGQPATLEQYLDRRAKEKSRCIINRLDRCLTELHSAVSEDPIYDGIIGELRALWNKSRRPAGQPESLEQYLERRAKEESKSALNRLDGWLNELYRAVGENSKMAHARFSAGDWIRAQRLSTQLIKPKPVAVQDGYTLPVVLNAAWWCRIQRAKGDAARLDRIGRQALNLCKQIVEGAN
jgi:hypothetical protein